MTSATAGVTPRAAWVFGAAALVTAASATARLAVSPSELTEIVALLGVGPLTLIGWLAWRLRSGGAVAMAITMVGLAAAWGAGTGNWPWSATRWSILASPDVATWVAIPTAVAVAILAVAAADASRSNWLTISNWSRWSRWPAATLVTMAAVVAAALGAATVTWAVSAVAAVAWVIVAAPADGEPGDPQPGRSAVTLLVAGAVGVAATTQPVLAMLAHRSPDRLVLVDGATLLHGPLFVTWTWVVIFGLSAGWVTAAAIELVTRRTLTRFGDATALAALAGLTFLTRTWGFFEVVTARRDGGDQFFYHTAANLLAQGRGYINPVVWAQDGVSIPSAFHGPAFPTALAAWSRLGGTTYLDHQLASVVLGIPQVIVATLIAHLIGGRRVAAVAAALAVIYPNIWITDGSIWVEGMMAGVTTTATYVLYRWYRNPTRASMAGFGALVGLAALTRGEALLMIPLLAVPAVWVAWRGDRREQLTQLVVATAAFTLVIAPWTIRNMAQFDKFVPLSTNSNEVLFYANCHDAYYGPKIGYWSFACQERYRAENGGDPPGDESVRNATYGRLGMEYARAHPQRAVIVVGVRALRQWELFRPRQNIEFGFVESRPATPLRVGLAMYYAMMIAAAFGSRGLRRRGVPIWPIWGQAVMVTAAAVYAYANLRFRAPFEPLLCVLAAVGVVELTGRLGRYRRKSDAAST